MPQASTTLGLFSGGRRREEGERGRAGGCLRVYLSGLLLADEACGGLVCGAVVAETKTLDVRMRCNAILSCCACTYRVRDNTADRRAAAAGTFDLRYLHHCQKFQGEFVLAREDFSRQN